ncbi:MAG: sigma-70 family RNA polymerase sigma factor, partial [Armatimonadetes bacterium]|nr:sigma-70 family RNA polymerase sigma factor [Armatimonadota bacterium]
MLSDEQIIRRVLRGHVEEFRELMRRHQNAVFRLAYRIVGRREEAEDVVQEVFLRVYQNLGGYEGRDRFWPWVRRITLNTALRRIPREIPTDEVDEIGTCEDLVQAEVLRRLDTANVRRAIEWLPAAYRTAIILRYMEDLSYREIADLL